MNTYLARHYGSLKLHDEIRRMKAPRRSAAASPFMGLAPPVTNREAFLSTQLSSSDSKQNKPIDLHHAPPKAPGLDLSGISGKKEEKESEQEESTVSENGYQFWTEPIDFTPDPKKTKAKSQKTELKSH